MRRKSALPAVPALLAGALLFGQASAAPEGGGMACGSAAELLPEWSTLAHASIQLRQGKPLEILTIGSSSTLGEAASTPAATWPARLQAELRQRFPAADIRVVNKARRRQLAAQMLQHLDQDIAALDPKIVIWESGTGEAVRGTDPDAYRDVLLRGVERLGQRGSDVILMDMQFARRPAALINYEPYQAIVQEAAEIGEVVYFPRFAIMREWVESGRLVLEDLTPAEQTKVADAVYACVARLLADGIARAVR